MKLTTVISSLLLIATVCPLAGLQAQKPKKKPDVEIIDFGEKEKVGGKKSKKYKEIIIKTSPTAFITGRQVIELEKQLNDNISIQGGIGLTFASLWTQTFDLYSYWREEDGFCESTQWAPLPDECDYYNDFSIRKNGGIGPIVSASSRFYFGGDGFEGAYLAPVFRYSISRLKVQKVIEGYPYPEYDIDSWQSESTQNLDLVVHYGGQSIYSKMTFEWFYGAGIRIRNNKRQDLGYTIDGIVNGERRFRDAIPRLEMGLRVGLHL
jgi:hypothetical protein